jgi:membrane protease subunit HflC
MVLSPDSDFFRFFNSGAATGNSATPAPAPAVAPQPAAPSAPADN